MPSCSLGFESVKTVIMKSFKSHFHIWNLIMSWKHMTGAVSQRKISILKYPSHLLSAVSPLPPHNAHPIQKQQSLYCSPAPCWVSLHYRHTLQPAQGIHPSLSGYPTISMKGFHWAVRLRMWRLKDEHRVRAPSSYRGSWACLSRCWRHPLSCPQMHQSRLEWGKNGVE